ncbi:MAG: PAS domain S-box protein [bacterium]
MQKDRDYSRGAFDHAVTGMAILSTQGHWLQANRAALALLGYAANELAGTAVEAMMDAEDFARHGNLLHRVMAGDVERCRLDLRLRHHGGDMVWVELEAAVVLDDAISPDYLVVQLHDGNERKNAEPTGRASDDRYEHGIGQVNGIQAPSRLERQPDGSVPAHGEVMDVAERQTAARLEESEQRYRSLFDHHPDAVYWLDTAGTFLSANSACEATSGYRTEELVGGSFVPLILPEFLEATELHFRAAVAGVAQRYEVVIRHKDGHHVNLDVTNVPVVVGGQVIGVFGIARDLTGQRALEEQLRHSQKMDAIGQLAGGVAHDFNNILAAITGFAQLLESDIDPSDPRASDVQEILKGARRAATLTRHLLAFSRRQTLHPAPLDLGHVVGDTMAMLRPLMGGMLTLDAPAPACVVPVLADRTQLEQVLMNLALNARDAMPDGGTLTIEVGVLREPGTAPLATLTVRDTGAGMSPDVAARSFEPFFTTKARGEGTGLGLATVHGIVQQSGGSITLVTQPGIGSTFTVRLPLVDTVPSWPDADEEVVHAPSAATVLVVDDEESLRSMVRRVLERAGYRVLTASNGVAALDLLSIHAHAIDVLVSDVAMPEMGGVELAARATERLPGLPVILMSGYTPEEIVPGFETGHVAAFLHKPFMAVALLDVLERVVRGVAPRAPAG